MVFQSRFSLCYVNNVKEALINSENCRSGLLSAMGFPTIARPEGWRSCRGCSVYSGKLCYLIRGSLNIATRLILAN